MFETSYPTSRQSSIEIIYSVTYVTLYHKIYILSNINKFMKKETHLKAFEEHRTVIDWSIDRGIKDSQRILGFHTSRGIIELLSAYLHKINKIDSGVQINHRWFKSEKVYDRLPDFPNKKTIFSKMIDLENASEKLSYGSEKSEKEIKNAIKLFNQLEKTIKELMKNEK